MKQGDSSVTGGDLGPEVKAHRLSFPQAPLPSQMAGMTLQDRPRAGDTPLLVGDNGAC